MTTYVLSIIFGLVIGSFLNVVIFRTEKNKNLGLSRILTVLGGRSRCPKCKKTIPWHDNIPLVSFLLLSGRCRFCHKKISRQYPLVEMLTAIAFLGATFLVTNNLLSDWLGHYSNISGLLTVFAKFNVSYALSPLNISLKLFEIIFLWTIFSVLIAILVYDLKHMLIPDYFTIVGIIVAAVYNLFSDILLIATAIVSKNQAFILEVAELSKKYQSVLRGSSAGIFDFFPLNFSGYLRLEPESFYGKIVHLKSYFPSSSLQGAAGVSFADSPFQFITDLLTGTRTGSGLIAGMAVALIFFLIVYLSQETWMSMGDVKLVFFLGFLLGIFKTAVALFIAFELGAALGIILILAGRAKMKTALPFGPFLIVGAILSLLVI